MGGHRRGLRGGLGRLHRKPLRGGHGCAAGGHHQVRRRGGPRHPRERPGPPPYQLVLHDCGDLYLDLPHGLRDGEVHRQDARGRRGRARRGGAEGACRDACGEPRAVLRPSGACGLHRPHRVADLSPGVPVPRARRLPASPVAPAQQRHAAPLLPVLLRRRGLRAGCGRDQEGRGHPQADAEGDRRQHRVHGGGPARVVLRGPVPHEPL